MQARESLTIHRRGRARESIFKYEEKGMKTLQTIRVVLAAMLATALFSAVSAFAADMHTSSQFQGPKANKGTVTHSVKDGKSILTLSDDFVVPDTPDPHWQLVDSDGNVYLVDKLKTKAFIGTNFKKEIVVPSYVKNVAKVQIWCAFAEVNLGEASFSSPVSK
jgi:uncharacterized protein YdeI (BOF family)